MKAQLKEYGAQRGRKGKPNCKNTTQIIEGSESHNSKNTVQIVKEMKTQLQEYDVSRGRKG